MAIVNSAAMDMCTLSRFGHVWLFVMLWTVAHQASLSMGFYRQEYWSGLPCPPPGDLPDSGTGPVSLTSPVLAGVFFTIKAICCCSVSQSCLTLCNPMDCRLPGSSIHGILQARILEWVAISFSRESSRPRDRTRVFYTAADSVLMELPWDCILLQLFILGYFRS